MSRSPGMGLAFAVASALVLTMATTALAQMHFVEVGAERGILPYQMPDGDGGGAAAADYDDDGDVDIFVPTAEGTPDRLYRNLGDGQYEEIAAQVGLAFTGRSRAALWFDANDDARLDLIVGSDCRGVVDESCLEENKLRLYRHQPDGSFLDVTATAGFGDDLVTSSNSERSGIAAGDLDGDGALDLVMGLWSGRSRILVNEGDCVFRDATQESVVAGFFGGHYQPMIFDFDGDGWLDVYYAIDVGANKLWINDGDGSFSDRANQTGLANRWNDMGMTLGDYDNDGDFDIYVTNITGPPAPFANHNALFRNASDERGLWFDEVAVEAGVDSGGWGWGTSLFDADNDGWLDLAATNGFHYPSAATEDPSRFFHGQGGEPPTFADVSESAGFDDTYFGSALLAFDSDRDGDLDMLQTTFDGPLRLLENTIDRPPGSQNHLVVRPRMPGPNSRAIGAVVRIRAAGQEQVRHIHAGTSFLGQEPAEAFFGLGDATVVEWVAVRWPDGSTSERHDVAANQVLTLPEASGDGARLAAGLAIASLVWLRRERRAKRPTPPGATKLAAGALVLAGLAPCTAGAGASAVKYVDVSEERGILSYQMAPGKGGGIAAADFDDDGDIDLFIPTAEGLPDQLYRNRGDGTFDEVAKPLGLDFSGRSRAALWFDYDGDGRLDLAVAADCSEAEIPASCLDSPTLRLYRQSPSGGFDDVSAVSGLDGDRVEDTTAHRSGLAAGDLDGDGRLDLVLGVWQGKARVLRNDGEGSFDDITIESGIGDATAGYYQPMLHDFDGDGWLDLYYAVDAGPNQLWMNEGGGHFVSLGTEVGLGSFWNEMGMTLGDYDNDGDLDVYVTNIERGAPPRYSRHNVLFRNVSTDGVLAFEERAVAAGVAAGGWGWGTTFLDIDNDGWLDLAETNGFRTIANEHDPSRLFRNLGGESPIFEDASEQVGFDDTMWGSALVAFDSDRDGDLDLVQTTAGGGPLRLLENRSEYPAGAANYLVVRPRGSLQNARAIGAVVRIESGGTRQMRLIHAGTSFLGQEPAEAFFGVARAERVDRVRVEWPDGGVTELFDVPANQVLTVPEVHGPLGSLAAALVLVAIGRRRRA